MYRALILALTLIGLPWSKSQAACSVSTSPVAFGIINLSQLNQTTGRVIVDCDTATAFDVGISGETQGGQRVLRRPEGTILLYQLYSSASLSLPWGDNLTIGPTVAGTNDGQNANELTVYGAIPPQQNIPPGNYTGLLTVVLTF